jgi:hypothetical protein
MSPVGAAWRIFWTTSLGAWLVMAGLGALGVSNHGWWTIAVVFIWLALWLFAMWFQWLTYRRRPFDWR